MMWILKLILFFYNDFNPYQVNTTTFNNVDAIGFVENNSFSKGNYFIQNSTVRKNTNTIYWTNDFKAELYKEKVILN
jgi:hypothetical protein